MNERRQGLGRIYDSARELDKSAREELLAKARAGNSSLEVKPESRLATKVRLEDVWKLLSRDGSEGIWGSRAFC